MIKKVDNGKSVDFHLMQGGLLYQLYFRTYLVKPPLNFYKRRIIAVTLLCWLPLLLLTLLGTAGSEDIKVPFLYDIGTHLRFLVSLGLFIGCEIVTDHHIQIAVNQFIDRDIITDDIRPKFNKIVTSTLKLGNSYIAELFLLLFVYTAGYYIWAENTLLDVSTWYQSIINRHKDLTMAGYWYVYISIPIFQFILCRWYYRLFIWYRFLWKVSHLPLHLNCLHPDRAGGLGFLDLSISAFKVGLLAHTVLLAGLIVNRIWHAGQTLADFKLEIISILVFLLFLALTPLVFFIIPLMKAKRKGLIDYGIVAINYVNKFREKWIADDPNKNEIILGSPDIQSLADLSNSFSVANEMSLVPFNRKTILQILLLTAFPLFSLLLTVIPLTEIIDKIIRIIL